MGVRKGMRKVETRVLPAYDTEAIREAVEILQRGGLVAFPTDTVYGVAAHGFQAQAIERLYEAKIRPRDKAIPLLLAGAEDLPRVARRVPEPARRLAVRFWPGGLTLVLPRAEDLPPVLTAGGDSVAVRVPDHPVALRLIRTVGAPLATTSANLSGGPNPVTAADVLRQLGGRIELILDGGTCPGGIPSTVLDLTVDPPRILREGPVNRAVIAEVLQQRLER